MHLLSAYCLPAAVVSTSIKISSDTTQRGRGYYDAHFTAEEPEANWGWWGFLSDLSASDSYFCHGSGQLASPGLSFHICKMSPL